MKTKTVTLVHHTSSLRPAKYQIMKITDSIELQVLQWLTQEQVKQLCDSKHWKVTIQPEDRK